MSKDKKNKGKNKYKEADNKSNKDSIETEGKEEDINEEEDVVCEYIDGKAMECLDKIIEISKDEDSQVCPHCIIADYLWEIYNLGHKDGTQELALKLGNSLYDLANYIGVNE